MKRSITKRQEQALRLCHHDFEGLTHQEAADRMGITRQALEKLLIGVKEVAPQFFPILSKCEAKYYHHLTVDGWSPKEISHHYDVSIQTVYSTLARCRNKGLTFPKSLGKTMQYEEWMDSHTKMKF